MNELAFLQKAVAKEGNRPVLMLAHKQDFDGEPVVFASDGYRLHMVWDMPHFPDYFPLTKDGVALLKSKRGLERWKPTQLSSVVPVKHSASTEFTLGTEELKQALEYVKHSYSVCLSVKDGKVYLSSHKALFQFDPLPSQALRCENKCTSISLGPRYLLEAIKYLPARIAFDFPPNQFGYASMTVGEYGVAMAVIMPMSDSGNTAPDTSMRRFLNMDVVEATHEPL